MTSLIGYHARSNGIAQLPCRAVLSLNGNGIGADEQHPDTITIVRDLRPFPDGEAPPDLYSYDGGDWNAYGRYWYDKHAEYWNLNPADYYQIFNEQGGGEGVDVADNYRRVVKSEMSIVKAAYEDGRKCCILNLAGGSPGDFQTWIDICVPYIMEAWELYGAIYGRHLYGGGDLVDSNGQPLPGQPQRVIQELERLKAVGYGGGVVLTECGLDQGYGVADLARFQFQAVGWETALLPYVDMLIGFCFWETGHSADFKADYTDHLKTLEPHMSTIDLPRWHPPTIPEDTTMEIIRNKNMDIGRIRAENDGVLSKKVLTIRQRVYNPDTGKMDATAEPLIITLYDDTTNLRFNVAYTETVGVIHPPTPPLPQLHKGYLGVDVSAWQVTFDWEMAVSNGIRFAIIRTSDGMNTAVTSDKHDGDGVDIELWNNAEYLTVHGLPFSCYHFLRPGNIQAQADKVIWILLKMSQGGMEPSTAVLDDGSKLPDIFIDVEDAALSMNEVLEFYNLLKSSWNVGIYTRKSIWDIIANDYPVHWWSIVPLWLAAYGENNGTLPSWDAPDMPTGWDSCQIWQYTSKGDLATGQNLDLNSAGIYEGTDQKPPTGKTYDMLDYLRGNDGVMIDTDAGTFTQTFQTQWDGLDAWRLVKGNAGQYEYLYFDDRFIYRREDTSQGDDRFYMHLTGNVPGAAWVKRFMHVGETFNSVKMVQHYWNDCTPRLTLRQVTDSIRLNAVHDSIMFGNGQTLPDVIELEWLQGGELYWFAKGLGLVGFTDGSITAEYMSGPLLGRDPLAVLVPDCVTLEPKFFA